MAVIVAVVNWWYRLTVTGSGIVQIPGYKYRKTVSMQEGIPAVSHNPIHLPECRGFRESTLLHYDEYIESTQKIPKFREPLGRSGHAPMPGIVCM
jgi:hypothetical protein